MNLVDVGIVLFVIALAAVGYARGLIASALPLAGFVGGDRARRPGRAGAACPTGPSRHTRRWSPCSPGVLLGAFLAVALDGLRRRIRARIGARRGRHRSTGSAARSCSPRWACCSPGASAPWRCTRAAQARDLREAVQRSVILGALNDAPAAVGPLLHVLRRVDPTPVVAGRTPTSRRPSRPIVDDPDVRAAGDSSVSGARHRVRARGRGVGLGRGARGSWSPTRTSSPARTTRR